MSAAARRASPVGTRRVACETCHIPRFARSKPAKVEWYWSEAGQDVDPVPTDRFGQPTYVKVKGRFVWATNVRPVYESVEKGYRHLAERRSRTWPRGWARSQSPFSMDC